MTEQKDSATGRMRNTEPYKCSSCVHCEMSFRSKYILHSHFCKIFRAPCAFCQRDCKDPFKAEQKGGAEE